MKPERTFLQRHRFDLNRSYGRLAAIPVAALLRRSGRAADCQSVEDLEVGITDPRRVELVKDGITLRAALRDFDHTYEKMRFEREFYPRLRDPTGPRS